MVAVVLDQQQGSSLNTNDPRKISHFTNAHIASKLMSMGILPGSEISLIRKAPIGGGWYIKVDNKVIAMRAEEINCIVVHD